MLNKYIFHVRETKQTLSYYFQYTLYYQKTKSYILILIIYYKKDKMCMKYSCSIPIYMDIYLQLEHQQGKMLNKSAFKFIDKIELSTHRYKYTYMVYLCHIQDENIDCIFNAQHIMLKFMLYTYVYKTSKNEINNNR